MQINDLKAVINDNETIVWEGKPDRTCFILESIFNPLLPFALIWAIFDLGVIGLGFSGEMGGAGALIIGFMLLHMMPVWIYLGGALLSVRRYRNTYYIITDAGVYISGGTFSYSYQMKPFAELSNITMHRGIFDQMLGVGDVVFGVDAVFTGNNGRSVPKLSIINIKEYRDIYKLVKDMQRNIHADTMYPNDLRPEANHGYRTRYEAGEDDI